MKQLNYLIIFLLLSSLSIAQNNKYSGLYSNDFEKVLSDLETITINNDVGAIVVLHNLIEEQAPYIQLQYLKALSKLKDEEIINYINAFINRSNNFSSHNYREDPLTMRVEATKLLIENNDYSTIGYVFEYFNLYKPDFNALQNSILDIFPTIAEHDPSKLTEIKGDLIFVFSNSTRANNRLGALWIFDKIYKEDVLILAITGIKDEDQSVRSLSLDILIKYEYSDLNKLLKERLIEETGRSMRSKICELILDKFGKPSDLKYVIDYQRTELNETSRSLIGYSIQSFIPPRLTVTTAEMIDSLISTTTQMYQYNWIKDSTSYHKYLVVLEKQKNFYTAKDERNLCNSISNFLSIIDKHQMASLLTEEGYKFLHSYEIYIKEDIEKEYSVCD